MPSPATPDLLPPGDAAGPPDGCLGCAKLEDGSTPTVVLLSGAVACSWCPAWRLECQARQEEANAILRMANRETRRAHLDRLEARHGAEYRRRLEAVILATWERRRAAAAAAAGGADA